MHKAVILLTHVDNKEEALRRANEFMEEYEGNVWDWYQIGGRWTTTLLNCKDYMKWAKEVLDKKQKELHPDNEGSLFQSTVEAVRDELQSKWEEMGYEGENPYCNHYNLPHDGGHYDVRELKDCIDIVKEWSQDHIKDGEEAIRNAERWLKKKEEGGRSKNPDYGMYGWALRKAGSIFSQDFCFDCNVYNTENYDYSVPEDLEGWFAVIVDMHN